MLEATAPGPQPRSRIKCQQSNLGPKPKTKPQNLEATPSIWPHSLLKMDSSFWHTSSCLHPISIKILSTISQNLESIRVPLSFPFPFLLNWLIVGTSLVVLYFTNKLTIKIIQLFTSYLIHFWSENYHVYDDMKWTWYLLMCSELALYNTIIPPMNYNKIIKAKDWNETNEELKSHGRGTTWLNFGLERKNIRSTIFITYILIVASRESYLKKCHKNKLSWFHSTSNNIKIESNLNSRTCTSHTTEFTHKMAQFLNLKLNQQEILTDALHLLGYKCCLPSVECEFTIWVHNSVRNFSLLYPFTVTATEKRQWVTSTLAKAA